MRTASLYDGNWMTEIDLDWSRRERGIHNLRVTRPRVISLVHPSFCKHSNLIQIIVVGLVAVHRPPLAPACLTVKSEGEDGRHCVN
jgi:hypothetical protein